MIGKKENEIITIIYVNRNKPQLTIKRSLSSLDSQNCKNFNVLFIDYGSTFEYRKLNEILVNSFSFCSYLFIDSSHLPWNRSHAINIGIKNTKTDYVFISDVDMIYRSNFTHILNNLVAPNTCTSFRVAYLKKSNKNFEDYRKFRIDSLSNDYSHGMTLFNKCDIEKINFFDEKFVYWGGEDNDIIFRLKDKNICHSFYEEITMYHQWHKKLPLQEDSFLFELSKFLLNEYSENIFCKNRDRGEVEYFDINEYSIRKVKMNVVNFTFFLDKCIKENFEKKVCVKIPIVEKRVFRYSSGKTKYLMNKINRILIRFNYKISWNDSSLKLTKEMALLKIFNYKFINRNLFDIQGLIIQDKFIELYIEVNNE